MKRDSTHAKLRRGKIARKRSIRRRQAVRKQRSSINSRRVRIYYNGEERSGLLSKLADVTHPPEVLSLEKNPDETVNFLSDLREGLMTSGGGRWIDKYWMTKKNIKLDGYISMDGVKYISTSEALIIAAEYERASVKKEDPLYLVSRSKWDRNVHDKLVQIGFFDLLGIVERSYSSPANDNISTVRFYSGTNASSIQIGDEKLLGLIEHIDPKYEIEDSDPIRHALNNAIGEAMINVRGHAYPENYDFKYPHCNMWWATGSADKGAREITSCIYDQGVSIPVKYKTLPAFQQLIRAGRLKVSRGANTPYSDDPLLIQAATKYGKSSVDVQGRGNGLPSMKSAIVDCGGGSLMIVSRAGYYKYSYSFGRDAELLKELPKSVGGTLIEWKVQLPVRDAA